MSTPASPSDLAIEVLRSLRDNKLVLVDGPSASGKSYVLGEVAHLFESFASAVTAHGSGAPIQAGAPGTNFMPSPNRSKRKVFRIVMNQSTRYSQVWRDLEPEPGAAGTLRVSKGELWKANEWALQPDSTALMVIEELNRGPAVKALGPGIMGLETDKRGDDHGNEIPGKTFPIKLPDDHGNLVDTVISPHLYVVCAQNNADTSVEPIDSAWYRRFARVKFDPDPNVLRAHFGLPNLSDPLPDSPSGPDDVFRAAVLAWKRINERIAIGSSGDYLIGHGVLIRDGQALPTDAPAATAYVREGWRRIERHVEEVFYDQVEAVADVLRITAVPTGSHPYRLERRTFADIERPLLVRDGVVDDDAALYRLLKTIAEN